MKKWKVGVVGCGSIAGYAHFPSYQKMKDLVEVVACADIVPEKAKAAAEKYGIPHWYDSVEALLAGEPDVDYIDCCTWTAAHAPVTIAAAKAGKHVLCEKPLAANLEQGLAMDKAIREAGVTFMLAVCTRYGSEQQKFIELRDEGVFGDIYFAKTAYVRRRGVPGGWFTNKAIAGEPFNVYCLLRNVGADDITTVQVKANDKVVAEKLYTVCGGTWRVVEIPLTLDAGTYTIELGGMTQTLTVEFK